MKKPIFAFIFFALLLFSCAKEKPVLVIGEEPQAAIPVEFSRDSKALEQQPTETQKQIKREIKDVRKDIVYYPIEPAQDIFTGLFDDISDANYDEWGDGFTVTYERSSDPFLPQERYVVKNDLIVVEFHNTEEIYLTPKAKERMIAQGRRTTGFIAVNVTIKGNTNEYRLGNYIGRNTNELLDLFNNLKKI